MTRRVLLVCGNLSSVLYVLMNVVCALRWEGYSSMAQTVSELSAIGAPTRTLWLVMALPYTVLVTAFGCGISMSAREVRPLRAAGGLLVVYGLLGIGWPYAPMHLRGDPFTLTDTMHIAFAMVTVVLMLLAIGFGSVSLGRRFRAYSIATLLALAVFGTLTGLDSPRIAANLPTPWIGVWERINIAVFLLWVIVLALSLLRDAEVGRLRRREAPSPDRPGWRARRVG